MNGGPRVGIDSPVTGGVFGNLFEFAGDCTSLAELQVQLTALDARDAAARAAVPLGAAVLGLALLLAGVPVLLVGGAELLHAHSTLGRGGAYLAVAATALVLGAGLGWFGLTRLARVGTSFARSREELTRNLAWVKTVLAYSGRSSAGRRSS